MRGLTRTTKSADFLCVLMDLGGTWETKKSHIFIENEVVDRTCCSSVANLGAVGTIL